MKSWKIGPLTEWSQMLSRKNWLTIISSRWYFLVDQFSCISNFPWSVYLVETQTVFLGVASLQPKSKPSRPSHQTISVTERSHNPKYVSICMLYELDLVCGNFKLSLKGDKFWECKKWTNALKQSLLLFIFHVFLRQETSDLTFMIEGKPVYVHKAMLKIR